MMRSIFVLLPVICMSITSYVHCRTESNETILQPRKEGTFENVQGHHEKAPKNRANLQGQKGAHTGQSNGGSSGSVEGPRGKSDGSVRASLLSGSSIALVISGSLCVGSCLCASCGFKPGELHNSQSQRHQRNMSGRLFLAAMTGGCVSLALWISSLFAY